MKTTQYIEKEMERIRPFTTLAKFKTQFDELKTCLLYLQTNPGEERLKKQLNEVEEKITILTNKFQAWITSNRNLFSDEREATRFYESKFELPKLRKQVETLNFLLS